MTSQASPTSFPTPRQERAQPAVQLRDDRFLVEDRKNQRKDRELPSATSYISSGPMRMRTFKAAVLATFVLGVVLRLPTFGRPMLSDDEAIYATTADAMARGDLLYRDVVDHKPPLIYHVYQAGFALFGPYTTHGAHVLVRSRGAADGGFAVRDQRREASARREGPRWRQPVCSWCSRRPGTTTTRSPRTASCSCWRRRRPRRGCCCGATPRGRPARGARAVSGSHISRSAC